MDLCLSCKAANPSARPTWTSRELKAEWLQHYHDANGVPLRSWIVARFADSRAARLASLPALYNAVLQTPALRRIANRLLGFHPDRTMPRLNPVRCANGLRDADRSVRCATGPGASICSATSSPTSTISTRDRGR